MLETFHTSATTQSTLGNVNWNGEIGDIRESIRRVNELAKRNAGREDAKPADLIVFTPEAFDDIEQHQSPPVAIDKPLETIGGIEFEIVAGDIPAMLRAMQVACLGKRVILVTKGEAGFCVREYCFPGGAEKMQAASNPRYMFQEVEYNAGLGSCSVPVPIPYSPFIDLDEPIRFNPKW